MTNKKHFLNELKDDFPELFSFTLNTPEKVSEKLNKQLFDLRLGEFFSYILNNETHLIQFVSNSIFKVLPLEELPTKYETITDLYHDDDIDFIKFSEKKGFEFIKKLDNISDYIIEYSYRMKNKENEYNYFVHQTIHLRLSNEKTILYTFHKNINLDNFLSNNRYVVTIRNFKSNTIIHSFNYDAMSRKCPSLSKREIEILALIVEGFSDKKIADKLFISFNTVRTHRKNILRKTEFKTSIELVNKYKNYIN